MNTELTSPILIISIKHRPWYIRWATINHWNVQVEYRNRLYHLVCWGDTDEPSADDLLYSIKKELQRKIQKEHPEQLFKDIYSLIGQQIFPK